ncbi:MAG: hypothetical protein JW861_09245 [Bacteroidales bacterium]|nr:hypothetical protein [Bacteroidales bacterium]
MKRTLIVAAMVLMGITMLNAQETMKSGAGNFTAEVEFRPLSANPVNLTYFRGRYFASDDLAIRIGVNFNMRSYKSEPNGDDELKRNTLMFGIYPGFEKHFGDMSRLSPYIGGELGVAVKSSKDLYTDANNDETEYTGAWSDGSERGFLSFGVNFLAGTDFYFGKHVFLGVEMGFGVMSVTDSEVSMDAPGGDQTLAEKENYMEVGVNFNPALRLGFAF